jgi:hypothetical protein
LAAVAGATDGLALAILKFGPVKAVISTANEQIFPPLPINLYSGALTDMIRPIDVSIQETKRRAATYEIKDGITITPPIVPISHPNSIPPKHALKR